MPLLALDHEGGLVQRFSGEGFSILPSMRLFTEGVSFSEDDADSTSLNARERNKLLNQSAQELSDDLRTLHSYEYLLEA